MKGHWLTKICWGSCDWQKNPISKTKQSWFILVSNTCRSQCSLTRSRRWSLVVFWRDMAKHTKHLAPLPCKERSGYLDEPSLAPYNLQSWDPEKDAQNKVRVLKKTSDQPLSSFKYSKQWPCKSVVIGQWKVGSCGGFQQPFFWFPPLSMTNPWPMLSSPTGIKSPVFVEVQEPQHRTINLKLPNLPPSSSNGEKNKLQ